MPLLVCPNDNAAMQKVLADPVIQERFARLGVEQAVALVRARGAQVLGFALNVTDREALDHMAAAVKKS